MLMASPKEVVHTVSDIACMLQDKDKHIQLMSLAATLLCMLHNYELSIIDVLNITDNMVYSGETNTIQNDFKKIIKWQTKLKQYFITIPGHIWNN